MPIMRRGLVLSPVLILLTPGCGGEDNAPAVVQPADSGEGVETSSAPTDSAGIDSTTSSDSSIDDSSDANADSSAPGDGKVDDSGTPDVPAGSDALFIADTYVDALKPEGGIPDASVSTDATFDVGVGPDCVAGIGAGWQVVLDERRV